MTGSIKKTSVATFLLAMLLAVACKSTFAAKQDMMASNTALKRRLLQWGGGGGSGACQWQGQWTQNSGWHSGYQCCGGSWKQGGCGGGSGGSGGSGGWGRRLQ